MEDNSFLVYDMVEVDGMVANTHVSGIETGRSGQAFINRRTPGIASDIAIRVVAVTREGHRICLAEGHGARPAGSGGRACHEKLGP